jgi:hypothetical protein
VKLLKAIDDSKCDMLKGMPLEVMATDQIVAHLKECDCPTLKKFQSK